MNDLPSVFGAIAGVRLQTLAPSRERRGSHARLRSPDGAIGPSRDLGSPPPLNPNPRFALPSLLADWLLDKRVRGHEGAEAAPVQASVQGVLRIGSDEVPQVRRVGAVSYTHLTLPTICSV